MQFRSPLAFFAVALAVALLALPGEGFAQNRPGGGQPGNGPGPSPESSGRGSSGSPSGGHRRTGVPEFDPAAAGAIAALVASGGVLLARRRVRRS